MRPVTFEYGLMVNSACSNAQTVLIPMTFLRVFFPTLLASSLHCGVMKYH